MMAKHLRWNPIGIVLGICVWGTVVGASPLSVYTSFSVRSPRERPNPFDYELSFGLQIESAVTGLLDVQRERDNGKMYTDQEYVVGHRRRWSEVQVRYFDNEENRLFIHSYAVAAKPMKWMGIGLTRQYARRSFGQGAWLGHLSVEQTWKIRVVSLLTQFVYESNFQRRRIFGKVEVQGFRLGPVQVIPFGVYEGLELEGTPMVDRYQGKIKLQVNFGGSKEKDREK
ncbi:MAG: hypothetical protein V1800_10085 [Candidatus Latescibacterota bacterium]